MKFKVLVWVLVFGVGCGSAFMIARYDFTYLYKPRSEWQTEVRVYMNADDAAFLWKHFDKAFAFAFSRLEGWGRFYAPIDVYITPSHQSLEDTTFQHGKRWMRGFGQYARIAIETPRIWGGGRIQRRFAEVLTHELTHCLMYQTACSRLTWFLCDFPVWFKEGLASFVAGQGWKRGNKADLRDYYLSSRYVGDPLLEGNKVKRKATFVAYEAAHWIFTDLVLVCGKNRVASILSKMRRKGDSFAEAFRKVVGVSPEEFARLWRDDLIMGRNFAKRYKNKLCRNRGSKTAQWRNATNHLTVSE